MDAVSKILQALITRGVCECSDASHLEKLNTFLRPMEYEAVLWPSSSHFVLKDNAECPELLPPWTEASADEIRRVFTDVALRRPVHSGLLKALGEYNWIEYSASGEPVLSKRTLIQFEDYLISLGGRYGRCKICGIIADSEDCHSYCLSLLKKQPLS